LNYLVYLYTYWQQCKKTSEHSTEAGLKYFVLGSLASGLLLFGTGLIYMVTGQLDYQSVYLYLSTTIETNIPLLGIIFIFIASILISIIIKPVIHIKIFEKIFMLFIVIILFTKKIVIFSLLI